MGKFWDAYEAGGFAALHDHPIDDCPFPLDSDERRLWEANYLDTTATLNYEAEAAAAEQEIARLRGIVAPGAVCLCDGNKPNGTALCEIHGRGEGTPSGGR